MQRVIPKALAVATIVLVASVSYSKDDGRYDNYGKSVIQNSDKSSQERGVAVYNDAFQSRVDAKRRSGDERGAMRDEINESRKAERYYRESSKSGAGSAK